MIKRKFGSVYSLLNTFSFTMKLSPHFALDDYFVCYSFGQCWTFWCMLHNVAIRIANTPTAAKLRNFFATVCNANYVLQEVAICVRGCGIFFSCMPELVESWNVLCHVASA